MNSKRYGGHEITLLDNDRILISGGCVVSIGEPSNCCEVYDKKTKSFKNIHNLNISRYNHKSICLDYGIIVYGGITKYKQDSIFYAELLKDINGTWVKITDKEFIKLLDTTRGLWFLK